MERKREGAVRVNEATRVTREVVVGLKHHRAEMVLTQPPVGGKYYIDAIPVSPGDFDRFLRLAGMTETSRSER